MATARSHAGQPQQAHIGALLAATVLVDVVVIHVQPQSRACHVLELRQLALQGHVMVIAVMLPCACGCSSLPTRQRTVAGCHST
jgi:hypothetical protein